MVTSACDDLSSAETMSFGNTHVTPITDLPFSFPLFGETKTRFTATDLGQVFLGDSSISVLITAEPQEPPDAEAPNGWLAPFWDTQLAYRNDVRVLRTGTGADERFVIGYEDLSLLFPSVVVPNPDVHLSFQVAMFRQSHEIEFRYCLLDAGPSPSAELQDRVRAGAAAIGLESGDGSRGVSYSFEAPLEQGVTAIRFTPAP